MSDNAFESSKKFGEDNFVINWKHLFDKVLTDKQRKHHFNDMNTSITTSKFKDNKFLIKGELSLIGEPSPVEFDGSDYRLVGKIYDRETKEFLYIPISTVDKKSMNDFSFETEIDFMSDSINSFIKNNSATFDLSVSIEWRNTSFEKRLGLSKDVEQSFNSAVINGYLIRPYLTETHENLSFKVEKKKSFMKNILN